MKYAGGSRAWRPEEPRSTPRAMLGVWSALLFNICMLALPLAGTAACFFVVRDQLYTYAYSDASARAVRARVERLSASLIHVDFDRRRQWDDLVAQELMRGDVPPARGFLLSARAMLPPGDAAQIERAAPNGSDAALELAALDLLTPGTRSRYESTVPLLSRHSDSGVPERRPGDEMDSLGAPRDFELLAGPMITGADADPMRFVLNGFGLGLGGEFTPRMQEGASALIEASRRDDYAPALAEQFSDLIGAAVPAAAFRAAAGQRAARNVDPASYPVAAPAFRAALDPARAAAAKSALDQIGEIVDATSIKGAAVLVTHARNLQDLPRLRLVARAAGDRAVAAAKNLPHNGRLARAAQGALAFNKDLSWAIAAAALAALGLLLTSLSAAYQAVRRAVQRIHDDIDGAGELVRFNTLRPL